MLEILDGGVSSLREKTRQNSQRELNQVCRILCRYSKCRCNGNGRARRRCMTRLSLVQADLNQNLTLKTSRAEDTEFPTSHTMFLASKPLVPRSGSSKQCVDRLGFSRVDRVLLKKARSVARLTGSFG